MARTMTADERGSAEWVAARLKQLPANEGWVTHPACDELIMWLYTVAKNRAARARIRSSERAEVAQDAMPVIFSALKRSRDEFACAGNPAAVLERVAERAVQGGVHRIRMSGLGGASANGRNWHVAHPPRKIGGDAARRVLEVIPDQATVPCRNIDDAARGVASWVVTHLGLVLTDDAADAVIYTVDRLVSGRTRAALVRGNRIGLASDPAMRYLGFDSAAAGAFARWLLGRTDPGHERPSVLDAALLGEAVSNDVILAWRQMALDARFAHEPPDRLTRGRGLHETA